jgi:hypothetical protein
VKLDPGSNTDAAIAAAGVVGLTVGYLSRNFRLAAASAVAVGWFGTLWWQRLLDAYYPASANP